MNDKQQQHEENQAAQDYRVTLHFKNCDLAQVKELAGVAECLYHSSYWIRMRVEYCRKLSEIESYQEAFVQTTVLDSPSKIKDRIIKFGDSFFEHLNAREEVIQSEL